MSVDVRSLFVLNAGKDRVLPHAEFSVLGREYRVAESLARNVLSGLGEFLKSDCEYLAILKTDRWKSRSFNLNLYLASCIDFLDSAEHYAICQPAIVYGNFDAGYENIVNQNKTHSYINNIDDVFLVVKGSVVRNFDVRPFVVDNQVHWKDYIQEINYYGFESLRLTASYLEVEQDRNLQMIPENLVDSYDLINRRYLKKNYDIGIDFSSVDPIYNGTAEYATNVLKGVVEVFQKKKISFQIIASAAVMKKFCLEVYSENIIEPERCEENFYKVLFIPQQIYSLAVLEKINKICLKYVFTMLDAIALRCRYIGDTIGIDVFSSLAYKYSDNVLSLSKSSAIDIESFFEERMISKKVTPILITKEMECGACEAGLEISDFDEMDYILIMGNGYKHKAIEKTLDVLIGSNLKIIVLADELILGKYKDHFNILVSGQLPAKFMDRLYQNSSLILYPSFYEGFGLPVVASLQLGKRILVYDSQINRELKREFDKNDLVYFFDSFSSISAIIEKILSSESENRNNNSIKRTWKDVGEEVVSILLMSLHSPIDVNKLNQRIVEISSTLKVAERFRQVADKDRQIGKRDRIVSKFKSIRTKILRSYSLGIGHFLTWPFRMLTNFFSKRR